MGDFGVTVGDPCGAGCICAGRFVELEFGVRLPGVVEPATDVSATTYGKQEVLASFLHD